jgi:hypothetical protein
MELELGSVQSPERVPWYRNPDIMFPLLLAFLGVLFFADTLFSSKNFYFRDLLNFHLPLRKVMIDSYARGEFPLWNPRVYLGQPMLANPNYMALYPTILLNLVLPFAYAFKLHLILHAILAGIGIFFLQRRMGIAPLPSLAGSVAYQFSGAVISMLNLYNIAPCVALLPWVGWSFLGCLKRFSKKRVLGFGALFAIQIMLMEPFMMQCAIWLIAAISAIHLIEATRKREAVKILGKVVLWGTLFAAGLSAIQMLPSLELLQHSVRGKGYNNAVLSYWSMHPADLVNVIVPNLFGSFYTLRGDLYWGERFHSGREGYLISLYLGSSIFLLALVSFFSSRKKLQAVLMGLTLISTVFSLGQYGYVYLWISKWLPFLHFGRYSVKYMLLTSLGLCILASIGLEAVLDRKSAFHRRRLGLLIPLLIGVIAGGLCLAFSIYVPSHSSTIHNVLRHWLTPDQLKLKDLNGITKQLIQSFRWAGLFSLISVLLVFSALAWKRTSLPAALLIFAIGAELVAQNARLSPLLSGADFSFVSEVDRYVAAGPGAEPCRVYHVEPGSFLPIKQIWAPNHSVAWIYLVLRRTGHPIFGVMNGVQYSISGSVDDLNTKESNEILRKSQSLKAEEYMTLLGRLNSATLLTLGEIDSSKASFCKGFDTGSDRKVNVYRLKDFSPRAFFVSSVHWAVSPEEALQKLLDPKFPYQETAILEGTGRPEVRNRAAGKVRITNYENNSVRCEVESGVRGYLILLDSYYPGWQATLDGAPVPILRANYAFRAVEVTPGKHVVEFHFRPRSFSVGVLISTLTLVAGLGVLFEARSSERSYPSL